MQPVSSNSAISASNQLVANTENVADANKIVIQSSAISEENAKIRRRKSGGSKENTPIAANVGKVVHPAPDNSEIESQMTEKGQPLERRVFKNHQVLVKIERIDLNDQTIKVYLKNGKIVYLPEGKVENFLTAPASDILKALDIK